MAKSPPHPAASDTPDDETPAKLSKSARKRRAQRLAELAAELTELKHSVLLKLPLDEHTFDAIREYQQTPSYSAKKRALQRASKLMRLEDEAAVRAALVSLLQPTPPDNRSYRQAEQWRRQLLADPDYLPELLNAHPHLPARELRAALQDDDQQALFQALIQSLRDQRE